MEKRSLQLEWDSANVSSSSCKKPVVEKAKNLRPVALRSSISIWRAKWAEVGRGFPSLESQPKVKSQLSRIRNGHSQCQSTTTLRADCKRR
ncbi:hypothetical protein CDAR_403101 [Caerostris darwini]|uniref:Uncharacterized protein n=1 Tax=Caerostris darwini TaxID=1538125 RepID=A0AAV4X2Z3_9ARAC|nr:hypothetical protein CDAR_403101 [Caerostris darwini]